MMLSTVLHLCIQARSTKPGGNKTGCMNIKTATRTVMEVHHVVHCESDDVCSSYQKQVAIFFHSSSHEYF